MIIEVEGEREVARHRERKRERELRAKTTINIQGNVWKRYVHVSSLGASDCLSKTKNVNHSLVLSSSLTEHEKNSVHQIDRRNVRILWRDNIRYRLIIKESLVIRAYEPSLNRTTHSVPSIVFLEGL
jgi:hypothetical protein